MKTNTIELRSQIKKILEKHCKKVFFNQTDAPVTYPYCIFSLTLLFEDYGRKAYQLEVNIIDLGKSTERVEIMADSIQDLLDHFSFSNEKISFTTYIGQRNLIPEQNKEIKKTRLLFNLYVYSKEE